MKTTPVNANAYFARDVNAYYTILKHLEVFGQRANFMFVNAATDQFDLVTTGRCIPVEAGS